MAPWSFKSALMPLNDSASGASSPAKPENFIQVFSKATIRDKKLRRHNNFQSICCSMHFMQSHTICTKLVPKQGFLFMGKQSHANLEVQSHRREESPAMTTLPAENCGKFDATVLDPIFRLASDDGHQPRSQTCLDSFFSFFFSSLISANNIWQATPLQRVHSLTNFKCTN